MILLVIFGGGTALSVALALISIGQGGFTLPQISLLILSVLYGLAGYQLWRWNVDRKRLLSESRTLAETAQTELARQRNVVDALADGLDTAVFVCDPKANILYANQRAKELFRFDGNVRRTLVEVTLSYDLEQLVLTAAKEDDTLSEELNFTYPAEIVGRVKAWVINHPVDRVYVSIYEITDLRRLERVRRDFVANVSHELRTPLTLIRAMAETLLDEDEADRRNNYLTKIVSEVDRLSMISQDLLELSTAESNPVRKQASDIAEIVRNIVGQLQTKAREKTLKLTYEGEEHLLIAANTAQMSQVALNLIDNALNYTAEGSVHVRVARVDDDAVMWVTDTGIGISFEHASRVFERFYRVDKARSRFSGGTGLGLSIVKHIVEAHGGTVSVDSTLNVGSTFKVVLPID